MKICVYAASSGQVPEKYVRAASELGVTLARRGHTLVNGAGRTGLMGAATDAALAEGGEAVGVIPQFMIDQGWQHTGMTRLVVTPDMHTRKERMASEADACIALPGGVGTLEELLEIITWKQLGLYLKPIVVLNTDGYFDALLAQLDRAVSESFMRPFHTGLWRVARTPQEAVSLCEETPLWDASLTKFAYQAPKR
ncbi:MAG: TIGR00730 family Rossman fold protein [Bacteroidaceae bacterium]|nr:TIGR00730 family Rossman fold protein [Bacteroidaceae bacterium]